jgi:glutathione S-transferase
MLRFPDAQTSKRRQAAIMILIGQYDSPFVRRVAVTLHCYEIPFGRRVLSVFTDFDVMLTINPLGKVPVLLLDDGERLFDSRAILDYLDSLAAPDRRLVPSAEPRRREVLRIDAVATGVAEKLYERGYEFARRDPAKRDPEIVARVERQIDSALSWLEKLVPSPWLLGDQMSRADITTAIAFTYMIEKHRSFLDRRPSPVLDAHCRHCEALPQFARAAYSASEAERSGWHPDK